VATAALRAYIIEVSYASCTNRLCHIAQQVHAILLSTPVRMTSVVIRHCWHCTHNLEQYWLSIAVRVFAHAFPYCPHIPLHRLQSLVVRPASFFLQTHPVSRKKRHWKFQICRQLGRIAADLPKFCHRYYPDCTCSKFAQRLKHVTVRLDKLSPHFWDTL